MKALRLLPFLAGLMLASSFAKAPKEKTANEEPQTINLATALRLAGAQNVEIKLVAEKVVLARAEHHAVQQQYFPWLAVGAGYHGHQENIQAVDGQILDVEKSSLDLGVAVKAQLEIGETYYRSLAARQLVKASEHALESQRQTSLHAAARAYFDLVRAQSEVKVAGEALHIASDYETQVKRAVDAGIAFAGDAYRIQTQVAADELSQRQAQEIRRIAAARLAEILHLDSTVNLVAADEAVGPLKLSPAAGALPGLVQRALRDRPEMHMTAAQREAARTSRDGAKYAPLFPAISAQYSYGGLAGGRGTEIANYHESSDYGIGIYWRIGPGGLFDRARQESAESRLRSTELDADKLRDEIAREVVESKTRVASLAEQLTISERILASAQKTLELSRDRKEFGVGIVAETIQSEQDLTRARREYLGILASYNQACFTLRWALGALLDPGSEKGRDAK